MRGVLPDELLTRRTKATGSAASAGGLRRHRGRLAGIWADSQLAELGLIDAGQVGDICASPDSPHLADNGVVTTLACETWLRSTSAPVASRAPSTGR